MNIILTGFMGTGKTATGKRLAKRLGWKFVDIDEQIEAAAKMPITRIFSERGEAVFRRLERRLIHRVAHGHHQVIATGGGAFVDPKSRGVLRAIGTVVCLTAAPPVILARVGKRAGTRPLLAGPGGVLGRIKTLLAQRAPAYKQADLTIDTSRLSVEETVERLWRQLSPCLCQSWEFVRDHTPELAQRYAGKYVVVVGQRIVAAGPTQLEAYRQAAQRMALNADAGIYYIPLPEESLTAF
jgi:shikimate kinase